VVLLAQALLVSQPVQVRPQLLVLRLVLLLAQVLPPPLVQ
jgi:hypothetical protein